MNGKGDGNRTNDHGRYRANWDRAFSEQGKLIEVDGPVPVVKFPVKKIKAARPSGTDIAPDPPAA